VDGYWFIGINGILAVLFKDTILEVAYGNTQIRVILLIIGTFAAFSQLLFRSFVILVFK
jgi:hypothetical protein